MQSTADKLHYSVLMPVYERENPAFLRQSVESMFAQTLPPDEFVLVIDGPVGKALSCEIETLCQRFEIRTVPLAQNGGLAAALNAGLAVCSHEIVARMDSDDIAFPERMERQLSLIAQTGAELLSAPVCEFLKTPGDLDSVRRVPQTAQQIRKAICRRNPFNHPAVVFRKSLIETLGGYGDWDLFEDWELFTRAVASGAVCANAAEPLLWMRVGEGLYRRRGGIAYIRKMHRFYRQLRALKLCSARERLLYETSRMAVALLPSPLRALVYRKLLRG